MPFISLKTNQTINSSTETNLKNKVGNAIRILGKTEDWLMLNFEDEQRMYFKGDTSEGIAFLNVKIYGKACKVAYDDMTKELTKIVSQELDISASNIYIQYEECNIWGYNGINL
jgi:hypothetical protein